MEEGKGASGDTRSSLSLKQNQEVGPKLPAGESERPCRQSCEQKWWGPVPSWHFGENPFIIHDNGFCSNLEHHQNYIRS